MDRPRVLFCSRQDGASVSIAEFLTENYDFRSSERHPGVLSYRNFLLLFSDKRHLYCDTLQEDLKGMGMDPLDIVFLSRHSSSAGIKSLTVHATGNFGHAELGGLDDRVSMSDPAFMTSSLRILSAKPSDKFNITFEATHHGPLTVIPSYFIEIGTTESEWNDPEALSSVSKAIVESTASGNDAFVGIGGGHYCPKITDYALRNDCDVGHIISKHSHNNLSMDMLVQTVDNTPGCSGFIMDNKGTRGRVRQLVKEVVNQRGMELIIL